MLITKYFKVYIVTDIDRLIFRRINNKLLDIELMENLIKKLKF